MIEDRIAAIAEQRRTLLSQKLLLENTLARTCARNDWRRDPVEFKLEECPAEYFLDSDISDAFVSVVKDGESSSAESSAVAEEQAARIVRHILDTWKLGQKQGSVSELQGNYRVGREAFLRGEPWEDFHLCTRVRARKQRRGFVEKPAGTYFKFLRTMNFAGIQDDVQPVMELFGVYEEMRRALEREGFTPTSDIYERELSLYTGNIDETIYSELSVRIDS